MKRHSNKQAGGTLLGIIIGLVIGLGIALIVAVTITKMPMPFMNKNSRQDKLQEMSANQATDPNRPMYGKQDAARRAASELTNGQPAPAERRDVATVDTVKSVAAKSSEPLTLSEAVDLKWTYYLQVGAFHRQAEAESTRAKLALQGYEAEISERDSENGTLYRVRLGPYKQLEAMNRVRSKLSESGMDVAVVRNAK